VDAALSTVSLWVRDVEAKIGVPCPAPVDTESPKGDPIDGQELRRCGHCLRDLPIESFNRHPTGRQWWCRDCYRAYFRARSAVHRRQVRLARSDRRLKARQFVADYLCVRPCSDCGEADSSVLEFHHVREKSRNICDMVNAGSSIRALERELARCVVVCANCHRLRTAAAAASWRLDPSSLDCAFHLTSGERRNLVYVRDFLQASQCVDCGDDRLVVLEFDHVGVKAANVTDLARRGRSLQVLETEVARCEVRCANCHRRRTLTQVGTELADDGGESASSGFGGRASAAPVRHHGPEPP
jgi:hypothetical protein